MLTPTRCVLSATEQVLRARITADGALVDVRSEGLGVCEALPPQSDALLSATCEQAGVTCQLDLYVDPAPLPLSVRTVPLVQRCEPFPPRATDDLLDDLESFSGCASGLVVQDEQAIAVRHPSRRPFFCDGTVPSELVYVDRASGSITATAAALPCTGLLIEGAEGALIAAGHDEEHPWVTRYLGAGRWETPVQIQLPENSRPLAATALILDEERGEYIVVYTDDFIVNPGYVVVLDLQLRVLRISDGIGGELRGAALVEPGVVVVSNRAQRGLFLFNTQTMSSGIAFGSDFEVGVSDNTSAVWYHEDSQRYISSTTGERAGLWVLKGPPRPELDVALFYASDHDPWALVQSPWDPDQVLVGLSGRERTAPTKLGVLLPSDGRYAPGSIELGDWSVVQQLLVSPDQRAVWALLPWSGELAIIEQN